MSDVVIQWELLWEQEQSPSYAELIKVGERLVQELKRARGRIRDLERKLETVSGETING